MGKCGQRFKPVDSLLLLVDELWISFEPIHKLEKFNRFFYNELSQLSTVSVLLLLLLLINNKIGVE